MKSCNLSRHLVCQHYWSLSIAHRSLIKCDLEEKGTVVHIALGKQREKGFQEDSDMLKSPAHPLLKACQSVFVSTMN